MNPIAVLLGIWATLLTLVVWSLWLIGWAHARGMEAGRKAEKGDIMRRIMTPEFTQDLVREVHNAQRRENLKRFGTPLPPHVQ
jgi:hypothetical protein